MKKYIISNRRNNIMMLFPSVLCDLIFSYCDKTVLDDWAYQKKLDFKDKRINEVLLNLKW